MHKPIITALFVFALLFATLPQQSADAQDGQGWILLYLDGMIGQYDKHGIYRVDLDGNNPDILNDISTDCISVSPSGDRIGFFNASSTEYHTYTIDASSGNLQAAKTTPLAYSGSECPSLSPDGNHIVFKSESDSKMAIVLVDLTTGAQKELLSAPKQLNGSAIQMENPVFSPNGDRILFSSNYQDGLGYFYFYTMDTNGGDIQKLDDNYLVDNYTGYNARYSLNGEYIMFSEGEKANAIVTADKQILKASLPGSAAFSPDSERVAFVDTDGSLAIMNVDGSGKTPLASGSVSNFAFSSDGTQILFLREVTEENEAADDGYATVKSYHIVGTDGSGEREVSGLVNYYPGLGDFSVLSFSTSGGGASVTDADGNVYPTVQIGDQVWLAKNLHTTTYNNGTPIPLVTDATEWTNQRSPAYTWSSSIGDNAQQRADYGPMYNEYAVQQPGLCPVGWRVPTVEDFITLESTLGSDAHLKLRDPAFWGGTDASLASGFNARPTGLQSGDTPSPGARDFGTRSYFWYTPRADEDRNFRGISEDSFRRGRVGSSYGLSVRCIQN